MQNTLYEYVSWRGDIPFSAAPFNEADSLIICCLSYLSFEKTPIAATKARLTLRELQQRHGQAVVNSTFFLEEGNAKLLQTLAATRRFGDVKLFAYVNTIDTKAEEQFSALCAELGDGSVYVAYRGTDNSVVGWKENFNMAFVTPVPAQKEALAYLERAAGPVLPRHLRVGGHSKGGNLAVYASVFCRPAVQKRIEAVYNHDGPGFASSILSLPAYKALETRVHTTLPQSSIVGLLLEHEDNYTVVKSTEKGLTQHNPYSWVVKRDGFDCVTALSSDSQFADKTLRTWVADMDTETRQQFVDALFGILEKSDITSVEGLAANWLETAVGIVKTLKNMDAATRDILTECVKKLFKAMQQNL
ncbi:MAG: Mbeg1-like protein [Oscillospiraceae bacterium]